MTDYTKVAEALEAAARALRELSSGGAAATPSAAPAPSPAAAAFAAQAPRPDTGEPPTCPHHGVAAKNGRYGWYCTKQGGTGPLNERGYCAWRP